MFIIIKYISVWLTTNIGWRTSLHTREHALAKGKKKNNNDRSFVPIALGILYVIQIIARQCVS